jgi:septal ring factor EnvC (AmiA/AmiB activator)
MRRGAGSRCWGSFATGAFPAFDKADIGFQGARIGRIGCNQTMHLRANPSRHSTRGSVGVSILIALAFGLCVLCGFQWFREAQMVDQIAAKNVEITKMHEQTNDLEKQRKNVEEELKRVEELRERLISEGRTNKAELSKAKRDLSEMTLKADRFERQGASLKEAFDKANENVKLQNESIKKLNEAYAQAVSSQKDVVEKYNSLATQCDDLSKRYQTLAEQAEKLQKAVNEQAEKK